MSFARFLLPTTVLASIILAMLVACGGNASLGASAEAPPTPPATASIVSGVAKLPKGEVAPRWSTAHIEIIDTSLADGPLPIVGAVDFVVSNPAGVSEIPFRVAYVDNRVDLERADYSVTVEITQWVSDENPELPFNGRDQTIYWSDSTSPVISRGNPTSGITVPLVPTNG